MRIFKTTLFFFLFTSIVWAQTENKTWQDIRQAKNEQKTFTPAQLFNWQGLVEPEMTEIVSEGVLLTLRQADLARLMQNAPEAMVLDIPINQTQSLKVELLKHELFTADFVVNAASTEDNAVEYSPGIYYHGIISGDPGSLVAISFFDNGVMGVLTSSQEGEMVLGALENDAQQRYILYETSDFQIPLSYECNPLTSDDYGQGNQGDNPEAYDPNKCVRIYFECEYDMFIDNGSSITNTVNYMTGIYNVVAILYNNENINTIVSQIFVWDTPDSYATSTTSNALLSFRSGRPVFNGDLAHLISRGAPSGGGVAWVDELCGSYNYAYSYVYNYYNQYPTYSWTVNVVAHEMGHNLGSWHTHDCEWDVVGDGTPNEAIDGCGPAAGYSGNGNCATAPLPTNGGTVMSYCHLLGSVGINPTNGFGQLPGDLIRDRVYNASCLTACSSCPVSVSIVKTDIDCNGNSNGSAVATGSGGTSPYVYAWSNGGNTSTINNLSAGSYTVTVTDDNGNGCSSTSNVTINEPNAISLSTVASPESVPGAGNGSIDLSVSGGTPTHSYSWSNGATSQDISNLIGGNYAVTVTDQNGCTETTSAFVESNGCPNQVSSFPYQESFESGFGLWEQGNSDNFDWTRKSGSTQTKKTGPGSAYDGSFYMYTEATGNSGAAHLISPCLNLDGLTNTSAGFAYHMYGNNMGILSLEVSTDNGNSWTTLWTQSGNQGNSWQTTSVSLDNYRTSFTKLRFVGTLTGGQRSDMAIDDIDIQGGPPPCNAPSLTMSSTDASCNGGSDGEASVSASGGAPPYIYSWSNGGNTSTITGLSAGSYDVTVTDATACDAYGSVNVNEPASIQLSFSITSESGAGANDGAIDLSVSNGVAPFTYNWSNGATAEDISSLSAGTYSVTVTDNSGCTENGSAIVTELPSCNTTVVLPYSEGFESGFGLWTQASNDDFDWTRKSGGTQTNNTGPSGAFEGNFYVYTESNGHKSKNADLISPCIDLQSAVNPQLSFARHLYGNQMGTLDLDISTDNGNTWANIWSLSGNQGNSWQTENISLAAYQGAIISLRFSGIPGGVRSDMAVDDISVTDGAPMPNERVDQLTQEWDWYELYPNPAKDQVIINLFSGEEKSLPIYILDVSGKRVHAGTAEIHAGQSAITVNLGNHAPGVYLIVMGEGKDQKSRRLVIRP